jgi:hypothetical protein
VGIRTHRGARTPLGRYLDTTLGRFLSPVNAVANDDAALLDPAEELAAAVEPEPPPAPEPRQASLF